MKRQKVLLICVPLFIIVIIFSGSNKTGNVFLMDNKVNNMKNEVSDLLRTVANVEKQFHKEGKLFEETKHMILNRKKREKKTNIWSVTR